MPSRVGQLAGRKPVRALRQQQAKDPQPALLRQGSEDPRSIRCFHDSRIVGFDDARTTFLRRSRNWLALRISCDVTTDAFPMRRNLTGSN